MNLPVAEDLSNALSAVCVGTGTCVPRLERRGPCTLVRAGGVLAAVDLGLGALHGMLHRGIRHADLDALLFTHLHPDHTAELVSLLFAANYDEDPRRRPLVIAGGQGLSDLVRILSSAYGHWIEAGGYELSVRELAAGQRVDIGGLRCRAGPARHIPSSLAYRFEWAGKSLVVSGDTGPSAELEAFARGADVLVLEASLPPGREMEAHLTARQAGEMAARAGVSRLVLTHLYPSSDASAPAEEAARAFGGRVEVAQDGMGIVV